MTSWLRSLTPILHRHRLATLIVGLFIALGQVYGAVNPMLEASDELWHYPVVRHLARGNGLPVQDPDDVQLWHQEGSQPPLTYTYAAAATWWVDASDMEERLTLNPHATVGVPLAHGNKNMIIHTPQEAFPYRNTSLALHLIRSLMVVVAAASVGLTYALGLEVFPGRRGLAALAASLNAFNPMFLFIAASMSNDAFVAFVAALTALLVVKLLQRGDLPTRRWLALGALLGLGALTKVSALALLPFAGMAVLWLAYHRGRWRYLRPRAAALALPVLLVAGWWYARNLFLYRDPLGLTVMVAIVGGRAEPPSYLQLLKEFEGFKIAFWSLFGGVDILNRAWIYWFFDWMALLGLLGAAAYLWRLRRTGRWTQLRVLVFLVLWVLLLLAALARWTMMTYASTGRLIFPGMSSIVLLIAAGLVVAWERWLPRLVATPVPALRLLPARDGPSAGPLWLVAPVALVLALTSPYLAIGPHYQRPEIVTEAAVPAQASRIGATFGGAFTLLGYELGGVSTGEGRAPVPLDRAQPGGPGVPVLEPGDSLWLRAWWRAKSPMEEDYSISVKIFGPAGRAVAQIDTYPGLGRFPTSHWSPGDVIQDLYEVPVRRAVEERSIGLVEVVVYRYPSFQKLEATDPRGGPTGRVLLSPVKLRPAEAEPVPSPAPAVRFGQGLGLVHFEVEPPQARPGERLEVRLEWTATAVPDRDYTVFLHLLDRDGSLAAQADGPPAEGRYPTSLWEPGETVDDVHRLTLPPDLPAGTYRLRMGLYDPVSGARLPLEGSGEDGVILAEVEVRP